MAEGIYDRAVSHLEAVHSDPSAELDGRLLDEAELVLPDQLTPEELMLLVKHLSSALELTQQDPAPLASLLGRLLHNFSFADVLSFEPPVNFTAGLLASEHMVAVNRLMLDLLAKATNTADIATIAGWPTVVQALLNLWLCTPDAGIASQASALIASFLQADATTNVSQVPPPGAGLMWKRIFGDRDVYSTFYRSCDLNPADPRLSKRQITLAQARLLELMRTMIRLDWSTTERSHFADIEAEHGVIDGGLLAFALFHMVDKRDDVLLHVCLIESLTSIIAEAKSLGARQHGSSTGLEYMISHGVHATMIDLYLTDSHSDPLDGIFLYAPASRYLGTYAELYPEHYLQSSTRSKVEKRLKQQLTRPAVQWAHTEPPKYDLQLLAMLPRVSLLPAGDGSGDWSSCPLMCLPTAYAPADVLDTLAALFHGPSQEVITFPAESPMIDEDHEQKIEDAAAARTLYFHYLAHNKNLWKDVIVQAETVAILDRALSAINLLIAVITARWSTERSHSLPSSSIAIADTPVMAILSPPALEYVMPYLNRPAQTFSNLVGGRGDAESSAYKIAMAKFDALRAMHDRLNVHVSANPDPDVEAILAALARRMAEGPLSRGAEVGGRIATLEL